MTSCPVTILRFLTFSTYMHHLSPNTISIPAIPGSLPTFKPSKLSADVLNTSTSVQPTPLPEQKPSLHSNQQQIDTINLFLRPKRNITPHSFTQTLLILDISGKQ